MYRFAAGFVLLITVGLLLAPGGACAGTVLLKEKRVLEAVSGFIMEKTANSGMEIRIGRIGYSGDLSVPSGKVTFELVAPRQWEGWGKVLLGLVIRVDERVVRNTSVPVEVEALTEMVVALRPLERGEVVTDGDVALQKRDLATAPAKICRDPAEVVGKKVRVGIRGNTPVRGDYLEKVPLVKYGQLVTIIAENGALRVTAAGKAKGAGAEGDLVAVQNLGSKKDVQARVLDSGTVAVDFQ
ncbi:flagellar basal body P-ring formation protein FlgA [bacterium]|nr:flagellar basal body P-ring formation protein FlgA [bacterium]